MSYIYIYTVSNFHIFYELPIIYFGSTYEIPKVHVCVSIDANAL